MTAAKNSFPQIFTDEKMGKLMRPDSLRIANAGNSRRHPSFSSFPAPGKYDTSGNLTFPQSIWGLLTTEHTEARRKQNEGERFEKDAPSLLKSFTPIV